MTGRLDGKVALITGAASGMGASHARGFVAQGAKVVIGDIADDAGESLAAELGDVAVFTHLDVTFTAEQWDLASDESSFSTGAEFIADGGTTAGVVFQASDRRITRKLGSDE